MSKATIILTDTDDGAVSIRVDFDPTVTDNTTSAAQVAAVRMVQWYADMNSEEDE